MRPNSLFLVHTLPGFIIGGISCFWSTCFVYNPEVTGLTFAQAAVHGCARTGSIFAAALVLLMLIHATARPTPVDTDELVDSFSTVDTDPLHLMILRSVGIATVLCCMLFTIAALCWNL